MKPEMAQSWKVDVCFEITASLCGTSKNYNNTTALEKMTNTKSKKQDNGLTHQINILSC